MTEPSPQVKLWITSEGQAQLLASRCCRCRHISFPVSSMCRACGDGDIESTPLTTTGVVEACSLMGELMLVHVRTDDGVRILGAAVPANKIHEGLRVKFSPINEKIGFVIDE